LSDWNTGLVLLQNPNDLLFKEAAALHVLVLSTGQNELQSGLDRGGNVTVASSSLPLVVVPDFFSARITVHPAARMAASWMVQSWSSVENRA
jgi:hypothetical protein